MAYKCLKDFLLSISFTTSTLSYERKTGMAYPEMVRDVQGQGYDRTNIDYDDFVRMNE